LNVRPHTCQYGVGMIEFRFLDWSPKLIPRFVLKVVQGLVVYSIAGLLIVVALAAIVQALRVHSGTVVSSILSVLLILAGLCGGATIGFMSGLANGCKVVLLARENIRGLCRFIIDNIAKSIGPGAVNSESFQRLKSAIRKKSESFSFALDEKLSLSNGWFGRLLGRLTRLLKAAVREALRVLSSQMDDMELVGKGDEEIVEQLSVRLTGLAHTILSGAIDRLFLLPLRYARLATYSVIAVLFVGILFS